MPAATGLRIQRIGQIFINVKDLDRATAFYRDQLGLRHLFTVPRMSFFDCGGTRLMLGLAETAEFDHPSSTLYFRVDDIHAAREELAGRGVEFEDEPHLIAKMPDHELWMTFFRDPDRNLHGLMCEVR
jgi:catechol 2,3-dioxygenase-like lactoylglutathione lyase family enzyme